MKEILNRLKSPAVWVGIISTLVIATGIDLQTITSWDILFENIKTFIGNPIAIFGAIMSIFSFLNNPTDNNKF